MTAGAVYPKIGSSMTSRKSTSYKTKLERWTDIIVDSYNIASDLYKTFVCNPF